MAIADANPPSPRAPVGADAVLLRDAVRTARRWQTYAVRAGFTGLLVGGVLMALHAAVSATASGFWDVADLGWLGRGLFVAFTVSQLLLAILLAPLMTASAVIDETDERTLELLVLTRLAPHRVLGGLIAARILVLVSIVAGGLPVLTLVVTLGGIAPLEVVGVTVHTLTTIVVMGILGAIFGLFTRSPMLAAMASATYAIPAFFLLPTAHGIATGSTSAPAQFSTFMGPFAEDWSVLLAPISYAPAMAMAFGLATRLFELRIAHASIQRAFTPATWQTRTWALQLGAVTASSVLLVVLAPLSWVEAVGPGLPFPVDWLVRGAIWAWFVGLLHVGTWVFLRVSVDLVDAMDRLVGRRRTTERRKAARIWSNPVAWREARPRAWGATALPILATWGILSVTILQTLWWLIPGGILLLGILDGATALGLGVWVATHSIAAERSAGTLSILLTSRMSAGAILRGKLLGVGMASAPMLTLAFPLLLLGFPHAAMWTLGSGDFDPVTLLARGAASWAWLCAVWLAAVTGGMVVAMRVNAPRTAFGITLGGLMTVLLVPFLAGRLAPEVLLVALPARVLAPPLAGGAGPVPFALGIAMPLLLAVGLLGLLTARLRTWGSAMALLLVAVPARAGDEVRADDLAIRVEAVGDPWVRTGYWTALQVHVDNLGAGTAGVLSLSERDASEQVVAWTRPVDLPEGARKDLALRFRPGVHSRARDVTLTTRDGRTVTARVPLTPVAESAVLVAVLGDDHLGLTGVDQVDPGPVPGRMARHDAEEPRLVRAGLVPPRSAPDHAVDWSAFDWIVWPQADPSRLSADQLEALRHTVADGGHLLLTVTDTWRVVGTSPLADALPLELTGVTPVREDLARHLGLLWRGAEDTMVATGTAREDAWVLARNDAGRPLWVAARYGLGTVHVLLANPAAPPLRAMGADLWRRLLFLDGRPVPPALRLALRQVRTTEEPDCAMGAVGDGWSASRMDDWSHQVQTRLHDIPGVAPIPLGWLVVFSSIYLLVIGPLDFVALRWLRREAWTWVTFPVAIGVFSAVALIGTTWTKGSVAVLTRVDLVDLLPGTPIWRGQSRLGVFSTRKTQLTLENGFRDAVIAPQVHEAGFMTQPAVASSEGPTQLAYRAETWTLAYIESTWTAALGQGPTVSSDGERLSAHLPTDLREAWLVRHEDGAATAWLRLGPVRAGETVPLGKDWVDSPDLDGDMAWVRTHALEASDGTRGHLHTARWGLVLVGIAERPVEPIGLTGLAPETRALTIVRAPLSPPTWELP